MAKNIKRHITHLKSKVVESSNPKLPASEDIELGEIAVNYAKGYETLSIKNESGDVVTFSEDKNIGKKGKLTGYAKASSASAVATGDTINTAIGKLEKALDGKAPSAHNQASNTITAMTGYAVAATSGDITTSDTLNAAIGKLEKNDNDIKSQIGSGFTVSSITEVIEENEEIISSSLNDLNERVDGKADASAISNIEDQMEVISSALNDLNTNKADKSTTYTKSEIDNMIGDIETLLAAI